MMKRMILQALCLSLTAILSACKSETTPLPEQMLEIETTTLELNRLGFMANGSDPVLETNSNVFWAITIAEADRWIGIDKMGGSGRNTLLLSVEPNDGGERSGRVVFELLDGTTQTVTVNQSAGDESLTFMSSGFDDNGAATMTPVSRYGTKPDGTGSFRCRISGEGAFVDSLYPSEGYSGASAGNSLVLEGLNSMVVFSNIDTRELTAFGLTFGSATGAAAFEAGEVSLQLSRDGENWIDAAYTRSAEPTWEAADYDFQLKQQSTVLYLRLINSSPDQIFIDDVVLSQGTPGEGYIIDFDNLLDDGRPAGYVYMFQDFDWITSANMIKAGSKTLLVDPMAGDALAVGPRWNGGGTTDMSATGRALFTASQWGSTALQSTYTMKGYLQICSASAQADWVSPRFNRYVNTTYPGLFDREGIAAGKQVNVVVSFSATGYTSVAGKNDKDKFTLLVIGSGTIGDRESTQLTGNLDSWMDWTTYSFTIYGATNETQLRILGESGGNRIYFDNFKVEKAADQ